MAWQPSDAERVHEICCAIESYAKAYEGLERIQRRKEDERLLPAGDQKTGAIGEFYALLHAQSQYEVAKLAKNGQPRWDIEARDIKAEKKRIQVKTVSAFSTTRRISPIHPGFHELWVLFLDRSLQPAGFWRIRESALPWEEGEKPLKGKKCPNPDEDGTGSEFLRRARNEVAALKVAALDRIALRGASLPRQDERNPDEIVGYDEQGVPG